jgi:hypothetical protein
MELCGVMIVVYKKKLRAGQYMSHIVGCICHKNTREYKFEAVSLL